MSNTCSTRARPSFQIIHHVVFLFFTLTEIFHCVENTLGRRLVLRPNVMLFDKLKKQKYFLFELQDNYSRLLQEQKPKKPTRKKPKPSAMTRSPKRNKKKRKVPQQKHVQIVSSSSIDHLLSNDSSTRSDSMPMFSNVQTQQLVKLPQHKHSQLQHEYLRQQPMKHIQREIQVITTSNDMFTTVCENSSAYESSEDTGVGGLSETELIGVPDGIFFDCHIFLAIA